jgi:hypothetical protein
MGMDNISSDLQSQTALPYVAAFETFRQLLYSDPFLRRRVDTFHGDLFGDLTRTRKRHEGAARIAPLYAKSPLSAHDDPYARITGFRLSKPVFVDIVELVHLPYIRQHARIPGEAIDVLLGGALGNLGFGMQVLRAWGAQRERLAWARQDLARQVDSLEGLWRTGEATSGPTAEHLSQATAQVIRLMGQVKTAEERLRNDGDFEQFRVQSIALADALAGRNVTWDRLELDGLLGEFHPADATVTIYSSMIRILSGHPRLQQLGAPRADLEDALRMVAEMHEMAHAYLILGQDCDGASWDRYGDASYRLHEGLATAYTRRLAENADPIVKGVWYALEAMLPEEYRTDGLLPRSAEELRAFVLQARAGQAASEAAKVLFQGQPVGNGSLRLDFEWIERMLGSSSGPFQDLPNKPALGPRTPEARGRRRAPPESK